VLTALAWLAQTLAMPVDEAALRFGFIPARFSGLELPFAAAPAILTPLTATLVHGNFVHLAFNLLMLMWCGAAVERVLGKPALILIYIVGAYTAAIAQWAVGPMGTEPMIGASGAISGVLGAYFLLYPRARVFTLIPLFILPWFVEIPAIVYLGFWFISQLFNGALAIVSGAQAYGGVAVWAHVGGFLAGLLLVKPFEQRGYIRRPYVDEYWPW